jgi:hypothetical protein
MIVTVPENSAMNIKLDRKMRLGIGAQAFFYPCELLIRHLA